MMTPPLSLLFKRYHLQRIIPILWLLISVLSAWLVGRVLFSTTVMNSFSGLIIDMGLDPQRSQFIAALILSMGTALIGAFIARNRMGALLGGTIVFLLHYLIDFIQLEQQPLRDPGGHLEPLNPDALMHTALLMIALALLGAFIGSAVGKTLSEVLLDPPLQLLLLLWRKFSFYREKSQSAVLAQTITLPETLRQRPTLWHIVRQWGGAGAMLAILLLVLESGNLFIFSPDIGLHTLPKIQSTHGLPAHGSIVEGFVTSKFFNGQKRPFQIYLPPSYNTSEGANKYYPTLYLLHGSPGTYKDWIIGGKAAESADTLIATGKISEMIIVAPDGTGHLKAPSEWGNSGDHRQMLEDSLTEEVIPYIDQHYRTLPDAQHRSIGGLSMGGFGAANIAVHHPDLFHSVISLGGYYRAEGSIWGKDNKYRQLNSPDDYLLRHKESQGLAFYIGAATKDQPYYTHALQFNKELTQLHIPYQFDLQTGYHSWNIWQKQLYNALIWLKWTDSTPKGSGTPTTPTAGSR